MAVVAVVPHRTRPEAAELTRRAAAWLVERGHGVRVADADAAAVGALDHAVPAAALVDGIDLAVSLGGDGTMLRTVDLVAGRDVPVLGVNVGHLGYLTEVEPAHLTDALARFFAGDFRVEERMTLSIEWGDQRWTALNEAVLEKTVSGHTVRVAVSISDRPFTTYAADGLIVATPTGSTAYNLSARGPIVSPAHRAVLLTPVSPHMLFDRSLVLDPSEAITLEVLPRPDAALVVDGNVVATVRPGDVVRCGAGRTDARLVTFNGRDFHAILKSKFGLADR